jgi:hypothetical protein
MWHPWSPRLDAVDEIIVVQNKRIEALEAEVTRLSVKIAGLEIKQRLDLKEEHTARLFDHARLEEALAKKFEEIRIRFADREAKQEVAPASDTDWLVRRRSLEALYALRDGPVKGENSAK